MYVSSRRQGRLNDSSGVQSLHNVSGSVEVTMACLSAYRHVCYGTRRSAATSSVCDHAHSVNIGIHKVEEPIQ